MGKVIQGILGPFSGKVGTVVGSVINGKGYMRGLSTSHKDAKTIRQKSQRLKFKLAQQLVSPASDFIKIGFRNYAVGQYARNVAMSYNLKAALTGSYPSFGIDPSKVMFSRGKLLEAEGCTASEASNKVNFTWTDNSAEEDADMSDFAMLIVYNFSKRKVADSLEVASRMDGKASLKIPASWSKDKLSCYIAFASVENDKVSDSLYIGDVKSDGSVEAGANGVITYEENTNTGGSSSGSGSTSTSPSEGDSGSTTPGENVGL